MYLLFLFDDLPHDWICAFMGLVAGMILMILVNLIVNKILNGNIIKGNDKKKKNDKRIKMQQELDNELSAIRGKKF